MSARDARLMASGRVNPTRPEAFAHNLARTGRRDIGPQALPPMTG
jgi:hypothetical protein